MIEEYPHVVDYASNLPKLREYQLKQRKQTSNLTSRGKQNE